MQENIVPFVPEPRGTRRFDTSTESMQATGRPHMTPCFASRVPTGRLPGPSVAAETPQKLQLSRRLHWASAHAPTSTPSLCNNGSRSFCGATTAEMGEAMSVEACEKRQPRYKLLRRARTTAPAPEAIMPPRAARRPESMFPSSSNSDLGDDGVQNPGEQLEAQLAWWRQQLEVLGQHGTSSCGSVASTGAVEEACSPSTEELHGCSEFLRLSLPNGSGTASSARFEVTCNGANEATDDRKAMLDCDDKTHIVEAESALPAFIYGDRGCSTAKLCVNPGADCAKQALPSDNADSAQFSLSIETETLAKTACVEALPKDNTGSADIPLSTKPETVAKTTCVQEQEQGQADEPDQEPQSHLEEESARALEHARAWAASLLAIEPQTTATLSTVEGATTHAAGPTLEGSESLWTMCGQPLRYRSDGLDVGPSSSPTLPRFIAASWAATLTPEPQLEVCGFEELFNL